MGRAGMRNPSPKEVGVKGNFRGRLARSWLKWEVAINLLVVPCSNNDSCLSTVMITPNDFVCCIAVFELSRIYVL